MDLWSMLQALVLFVAVLGLAAFTARAAAWRMKAPGRFLKIVEVLPIGPGKQVLLLAIGDRLLVLGVSDRSITYITTLDAAMLGDGTKQVMDNLDKTNSQNSPFGHLLKRLGTR